MGCVDFPLTLEAWGLQSTLPLEGTFFSTGVTQLQRTRSTAPPPEDGEPAERVSDHPAVRPGFLFVGSPAAESPEARGLSARLNKEGDWLTGAEHGDRPSHLKAPLANAFALDSMLGTMVRSSLIAHLWSSTPCCDDGNAFR